MWRGGACSGTRGTSPDTRRPRPGTRAPRPGPEGQGDGSAPRRLWRLGRLGVGGAGAEDVRAEDLQVRRTRVTQARQAEERLDRAEQRVVIVGFLGNRPRLYERREQHRTDAPAARAAEARRVLGPPERLLAAAGRRGRAVEAAGLIEGDDQQAV